uniref:Rho-GAP domain-containing protein n=1 Tax=Setaria digitata TaxID=48799 RepID=A0A915PLP5_9BILA
MVSTQDRPIPAPRISLTDRKPPIPNRTLRSEVIPKPVISVFGNQESNSSLHRTILSSEGVPSVRYIRRVKSLSDNRKTVLTNIARSASFHLYLLHPKDAVSNSDNHECIQNPGEMPRHNGNPVDSRNRPNKLLYSEGLEQGHVARIAKMLNSKISRDTAVVKSVNEQRVCSVDINSITAEHDFPSLTKRSKDLRENGTVSVAVEKSRSEASKVPELEIVPRNGLWNSGYIGLEAYSRMAELLHDDIWTSSGGASGFAFLDKNCRIGSLESAEVVNEQPRKGTKIDDQDTSRGSLPLSGWAEVIVCKKDYGRLWVIVEEDTLACWTDEYKGGDPLIGPYYLKNILYVGKNPVNGAVELHVRENLLCSHWTNLKLKMVAEVEKWILDIVKCVMPKNELLLYSVRSLSAGGSVWIRQGTACAWSSGWMFLDEHKLYYTLDSSTILFELDVRKFIGMKSTLNKVDWCASVIGSMKGPFLLLQEGGSLFVQAEHDSATLTWINLLSHQMECSGYRLEDSKLTPDDVPVIVDKCIKFISTYGLLQPGLYRRNGPNIEVRSLLTEFRKDPVNVHLLPGSDDMTNVVADVLRSFFRQLDSPLVPYHIQDRLFAVANMRGPTRLEEYHEILMGLPRIRIQTLRRVLDHLKDVTELANANLATVENVAKVFGPTLFSVEQGNEVSNSFTTTIQQVNLVKDLLTYYASIFRISAREMCIKSKINMLQEKPNKTKARADGFLVPVHILEKDNHTFNVQSSSNAEQVCDAARNRPVIRNETDIENFALFEEIKCGQLERRVNPPEKMSSMITGRWLDWEPAECFLLFKRDPIPYSFRLSYPFADDIRIAEQGGRSFSTGHLKLEGGLVAYYNKGLKKVSEWHTDDILWYVGHENGRKPPYPYTLTFILPNDSNFKYKSKYMGYCVAFREPTLRTQWLNAVISSQQDFHENSAMPLVQI